MVDDYKFPIPKSVIGEKIKRRRLQVLIHSCLYYELDTCIIEDHVFDKWCRELSDLLKKYPKEYKDRFDRYFIGWHGETGNHFPHKDTWIYTTTKMILKIHEKKEENKNKSTLEDFFG